MNRPPALPGVTLTCCLFQKGRILAQDGVADEAVWSYPVSAKGGPAFGGSPQTPRRWCLRCLLLVMCTHPFAKETLTLHLARSEGHERYFGHNLMHCKVLASSHQHLMAEAPSKPSTAFAVSKRHSSPKTRSTTSSRSPSSVVGNRYRETSEFQGLAQSDLSHLIAAASYCFAVFFAVSAALASRTFAFSAALALASRTFSHARTSRRRN